MTALVQLAELSWAKVAAIAIVAAALYYLTMFDNGASIDQQVNVANTELRAERDILRKTEEKMKDLESFREELNNQEMQVREVMNYLPTQVNTSELLAMIQDRATQAGLRVQKTDVDGKVGRVDFFETLRMRMEMSGTFAQLTTFMSLLSKLPRLVTVDVLELAAVKPGSPDPDGKLKITAVLVGYRYLEDEAVKAQQGGQPNAVKR